MVLGRVAVGGKRRWSAEETVALVDANAAAVVAAPAMPRSGGEVGRGAWGCVDTGCRSCGAWA